MCAGTGPENPTASVSSVAAWTVARSCRNSPSANSASSPPRPALMTMPNSRVLCEADAQLDPGRIAMAASRLRDRIGGRGSRTRACQFRGVQRFASRGGRLAEDCHRRRWFGGDALESDSDGCGTVPFPFAMPRRWHSGRQRRLRPGCASVFMPNQEKGGWVIRVDRRDGEMLIPGMQRNYHVGCRFVLQFIRFLGRRAEFDYEKAIMNQ